MECRNVEITLNFTEDLKDVNVDSKMDVDAVVIINGERQTKQKIPVDKDCGSNPKWNYIMKFTAEETAANQKPIDLEIYLVSDRLLGDIVKGKVFVPINGYPDREEKGSFKVRLPKGKVKGTLNLCCKIGEKFTLPVAAPLHETEKAKSAETRVLVYPAVGSSAGYSPQLPAAYSGYPLPQFPYQQPPPQFSYQQPPPQFPYQQPLPQFPYQQPPPQFPYQQPPPQIPYQQPPPQIPYQQPPPQIPYQQPPLQFPYQQPPLQFPYQQPPPQFPYQQPLPQFQYQQPPPYGYGASAPPLAQGSGYTAHLPHGGHGPALFGQGPASGLLSTLFVVETGTDILSNVTDLAAAFGG
ncbi:hypothetical protein SLA2020_213300 [Shorea laevis]